MNLLIITACPNGMVTSVLTSRLLEAAAHRLGWSTAVEVHDPKAIGSPLTPAQIANADLVVVVKTGPLSLQRFIGKRVVQSTPSEALLDPEGFLRPVVDEAVCVNCGLCQKVCPVFHPPVLPEQEPELLAAINGDDADRSGASSGGTFILLARYVLEKKGVVFGAAFQPDFSVAHDYAQTQSEVYRFCGSKYVQSKIGDSYQKAKSFLEQGRYVLFTGTPCQIIDT